MRMPHTVRIAAIVSIVWVALCIGCFAVCTCHAEDDGFMYFVPEYMAGYGFGGIMLFSMEEVVEYCNTPPISERCSAIRFDGQNEFIKLVPKRDDDGNIIEWREFEAQIRF